MRTGHRNFRGFHIYRRVVGYFSYDKIKYSEPKLRLSDEEKTDFRDMDLMLFDNVIAFTITDRKYLITGVRSMDLEQSYEKAEAKLNEIEKLLKTGEKMEFPPIQLKTEIKPQFSEEKYEEMVEKAKHYIRKGDIFQVVLSNPMRAKAEGSLFDTYRALRTHNPSPYMFYFFSDDIESAHVVAYAKKIVPQMDKDEIVVITLSGRGDKDCAAIARYRGEDIHE